jgi:hypothetical protein
MKGTLKLQLLVGGILLLTGGGDILILALRRDSLSSPSEVAMTTVDVFLFALCICRGKCESISKEQEACMCSIHLGSNK